jgi:hypothetical protein
MANLGFRAGSEAIIKKGLFDKVRQKQSFWTAIANVNVQKAFTLFAKRPILTGGTKKATTAVSFWKGEKLIIRFKTPNDVPRGWRVFPLLGLSTSRKYGERNWLVKGAKLTLNDIKKK